MDHLRRWAFEFFDDESLSVPLFVAEIPAQLVCAAISIGPKVGGTPVIVSC